MRLSLRVHYTIQSIPIIDAFVQSSAKYFGADKDEIYKLALVAEEASVHIIANNPSDDPESPFDIYCEKEDDVLRMIFSNTGLPVDIDGIPDYDSKSPECNIDGLEFFLMEKFADNYKFVNLGSGGWQTVIEKKLKFTKEIISNKTNDTPDSAVGNIMDEELSFSVANSEDTYQITKLAYYTYRYSYAKKTFYYPELLSEELASQQIISFVVKNSNAKVIAHSASLRSENSKKIAEIGAAMVQPEYRRTLAILHLIKDVNEYLKSDSNPGIDLVESNLVTAHIGSQRLCKSLNFTPTALKVSVHERAEFINIKDISSERESLLYSVLIFKKPEHFVIHCPPEHHELISVLLDSGGFEYDLHSSSDNHIEIDKSKFLVHVIEETGFANITVLKFGKDFYSELKKTMYRLSLKGIMTVSLGISLDAPMPANIDSDLISMDFFFSGVVPVTLNRWQCHYTHLNNHQIDFDKIKVYQKLAKRLKEYVKNCYLKVIPL